MVMEGCEPGAMETRTRRATRRNLSCQEELGWVGNYTEILGYTLSDGGVRPAKGVPESTWNGATVVDIHVHGNYPR